MAGGFKILRGRVVDITPDQFSITAKTNQALSSSIRSAAVTPVGYTSPATLTVTNGMVSINGGADTAGPTTISPGDNFVAVNQSSGSYSTATTTTISISGVSAVFSVTTQAFVPLGAIHMRSNDTQVVDLSALIALFRDTPYSSDRITVTNNGANLTPRLWNLSATTGTKNLANAASFDCVGSDLDYFLVSTVGMADADVQTITLSGVDPGGSATSATVSILCDNDPASQNWNMGAKTLGMFGGFPIHQLLQGNPQHWSVKSQTVANQMMVIYDATSRTETNVGTGITYANGYARLVLIGTPGVLQTPGNCSIKTQGDNSAFNTYNTSVGSIWTNYGGAPSVVPTAATSNTVVLQNSDGLPDRTIVVNWIANQIDVAPWPLLDQYSNSASTPTHQPGWSARQGAPALTFGYTWMWEQGEHLFNAKSWQMGFKINFGTTTIGGTAPTGLFNVGSGRYTVVTDALVYTEGATFDANLITWRARTPLTWFDQPRGIDLTSMSISTNTQLAIRMTGFAMGSGPAFSSTNMRFAGLDHCSAKRNDGFVSTHDTGSSITQGSFYISNMSNQAQMSGSDPQYWGNLFQGVAYGVPNGTTLSNNSLTNSGVNTGQPYGGVDTMKWGLTKWNSNDAVWRAQNCFNYMFNMKAGDDYGHWDWEQWDCSGLSNSWRTGPIVVGLVMFCGTGRNSTGTWTAQPSDNTKMLPGRNDGYFHSPGTGSTQVTDYHMAGTLYFDRQPNGMVWAKAGKNSEYKYNMWLAPSYVPAQGVIPEATNYTDVTATFPAGEDTSAIQCIKSVFSNSSGLGNNATYIGNVTHVRPGDTNSAWTGTHLVAPTQNPGLCDNITDVMGMLGYIVGQEVDAGPFAPAVLASLIDYRRRIYDPTIF